MRNNRHHTPLDQHAAYTCPRCGIGSAADRQCSELYRRLDAMIAAGQADTAEYSRLLWELHDATRARLTLPPDPEAEIREEIAATTPRTELLDAAAPLDCEQPAISTRAARQLKPARQDDLFNPNPQPRLTFPVEAGRKDN